MSHKMPLLGLHAAWDEDSYRQGQSGYFEIEHNTARERWLKVSDGTSISLLEKKNRQRKTSDKDTHVDVSHGSFDNDIDVVSDTLKRITGKVRLDVAVKNLQGF